MVIVVRVVGWLGLVVVFFCCSGLVLGANTVLNDYNSSFVGNVSVSQNVSAYQFIGWVDASWVFGEVWSGQISSLASNDSVIKGYVSSLIANDSLSQGWVNSLSGNDTVIKGYVGSLILNDSLIVGYVNSVQGNVTSANSSMKSYVDANNVSMKSYVDSVSGGNLSAYLNTSTIVGSVGNYSADRSNLMSNVSGLQGNVQSLNSNDSVIVGYVNSVQGNVTSANSSMKSYVDGMFVNKSGDVINGNLVVNGNFSVVGSVVNLTVENAIVNGSIVPSQGSLFSLGDPGIHWANVFSDTLVGSLDAGSIVNELWTGQISSLSSNASTQSGYVSSLIGNGSFVPGWVQSLNSNDSVIVGYVNSLAGNDSVLHGYVDSLIGNVTASGDGNNYTNSLYVTSSGVAKTLDLGRSGGSNLTASWTDLSNTSAEVISAMGGLVQSLQNNVTSANSSMKSYVDANNVSMKAYVDSVSGGNLSAYLNTSTIAGSVGNYSADRSNLMSNVSDVQGNLSLKVNRTGDLGMSGNFSITGGNLTVVNGYLMGQPLTGMLGSGIIQSTQGNALSEVNVSCSGLSCSYNNFTVRLASGTSSAVAKYCDVVGSSVVVTDNTHTVLYIDNNCAVQQTTIETWFSTLVKNGGVWDFANMVCYNGACEVVNGIGLEQRRMMKQRVIDFYTDHLRVVSGFGKTTNVFPNFTLDAGNYVYLMDVDTTTQVVTGTSGKVEVIVPNGTTTTWLESSQSSMNYTYCTNGTSGVLCSPTNRWRRVFFFMVGWNESGGSDNTQLHQLLASNSVSYASESACLDTVANPITYTLPSYYTYVAMPLYAYCIRPQDSAWSTTGWIDLRTVKVGSGTSSSTGNFVPYVGATTNLNMGAYNVTAVEFLGSVNASYVTNNVWTGQISSLSSNASTQSGYVSSLISNGSFVPGWVQSLNSNDSVIVGYVNSLAGNDSVLHGYVDSLIGNASSGAGGWTNTSSMTSTSLNVNISGNVTIGDGAPTLDIMNSSSGVLFYTYNSQAYFSNNVSVNGSIFQGGASLDSLFLNRTSVLVSVGNFSAYSSGVCASGNALQWTNSSGGACTPVIVSGNIVASVGNWSSDRSGVLSNVSDVQGNLSLKMNVSGGTFTGAVYMGTNCMAFSSSSNASICFNTTCTWMTSPDGLSKAKVSNNGTTGC